MRKSRRRKAQCPEALLEENDPSAPPQCKRQRDGPAEEVCGFCQRADCNPEVLGQFCRQDGLCVHENCLYHASRLNQRGADEEGFYGFLFPDIQEELKRVAQKFYVALTPVTSCHPQKCCICRQVGASVTCRARRCPRTFHYPCGSERGCIFQFFGEFKSFCWKHRPVQRVQAVQKDQTLCLICQEAVAKRPCYETLVCPTCTRAWFHRHCIQGQALRSALHCFCCPLCRDMVTFQKEMFRLGIKIPDRDAAWEENGAFADHYQRHSSCDSSQCLCPVGREVAEENGPWRLLLCHSCGSCGTHQRCSNLGEDVDSWECCDCSNTGTVPTLQAGQALEPPAQGPSHRVPAPDATPGDEEAGIPAGHPDTDLPSQALP
ncbi:PHD finger protein 7-like [Melopsittacus undulatus]|uniref:PHD finger protein 7-like n=1 Tax=Melopsittacus undulatus TaxID=13146 RepID=UPI00146D0264|nr:PHD finger protein 7-like [Melopsittacus undulatus]XP_033916533.1 PHD finger protein 7-like [Melopsittacus undulatus]